jgi:NAD(P)-dependent dehydrogenase (short-subunit alcohol dehydrogenase family)
MESSADVRGKGYWAVILGGSSGFGLATAKRLAQGGFNIIIGHKDKEGTVESVIKPHFEQIRAHGVKLFTHNVNLFEEDGRGELFESIATNAGEGKVHLFMHSVAAGACKLMAEDKTPDFKGRAMKVLSDSLKAEGVAATPEQVKAAVNRAFHEGGADPLYTMADSRIPYKEALLSEEDLQKTIYMMGYDYLLWARELLKENLLTKDARMVAMTSEGNEVAWKGYAAVSAAKCALEASCRAMALELAPYGVRSYIVQAGITDTPAGNGIPNFDLMKAAARLRNPFHRLTTPEDVAEAIYQLTQPGFAWTNGALIRVDGGEAISGT